MGARTEPSAPSDAARALRADGPGLARAALAFSLAAAASSWNPLAAPFGLVVGVASALLATRALSRARGRPVAWTALGVSIAALLGCLLVLALGSGVGRGGSGEAVVVPPSLGEVNRDLDQAAERTRESRDRARRELEELDRGGTK